VAARAQGIQLDLTLIFHVVLSAEISFRNDAAAGPPDHKTRDSPRKVYTMFSKI